MTASIALSRIHFPVTTLGPGRRIGIWFQGCSIHCPGCISMDTWAPSRGITTIDEVVSAIAQWIPTADGITISGGEPFDQPIALLELLRGLRSLTEADVLAAIKTFLGDQYQMPPMFSAIKIDGVPLYKSARKGEEIVREPRFIRVMSWDVTRFASPQIDFRLRCTKGTYVRTLAHDLGQKLGCGAHLSALRRTATDKFNVSQALTLDQIQALSLPEIEKRLIPAREAVPGFVP